MAGLRGSKHVCITCGKVKILSKKWTSYFTRASVLACPRECMHVYKTGPVFGHDNIFLTVSYIAPTPVFRTPVYQFLLTWPWKGRYLLQSFVWSWPYMLLLSFISTIRLRFICLLHKQPQDIWLRTFLCWASWMVVICCATTDNTSMSMRLNSSKHAQAPELQWNKHKSVKRTWTALK